MHGCPTGFGHFRFHHGQPHIRVDCHGHDCCPRSAFKQVHIADVEAGIRFCKLGIEVMRYRENSLVCCF
jgi:hypothetical protein